MPDWIALGVRFALYADLTLLFGLARLGVYALQDPTGDIASALPLREIATTTAVAGLILSGLGVAVMAAGMAGISLVEIDQETIGAVLFGMDTGVAALVRMAALGLVLIACLGATGGRLRWHAGILLLSAVALATLAWNGHAAMSEDTTGTVHLASDIVHLLAAGAWLGGLVGLMILLLPRGEMTYARLEAARRALADFSVAGSIIVALLIITGLINIWAIVGTDNLSGLLTSLYGLLLFAKIALFGAMVALAAANRFRLTPALERAMLLNDSARAARALRLSLAVETTAGFLILALVAWLGMLAPLSAEI
ncbi:copper homeostasis membrane protein CopD [Allosphingosinicella humi]